MRKLGIGLLGVGEMGKRHAENICRLVPQARLIAVADIAAARAQQVAADLEVEHSFGSLEDMLERKEIDCVLIASPDKFHAPAVRTAAAAGKDILCEKPLATNLGDARSALAAVAKAGVRLQVGFMRRYDAGYAAAMRRIEAGEIGEPVIFKSIGRDKDAPPIASYQSKLNGMLLYNNTIHDFDLARWLMRDEVVEVQAYTTVAIRPEVAKYGDVVASVVNLKYQHGAIGNIESYVQAVYGYDIRTEIVGSKGFDTCGKHATNTDNFSDHAWRRSTPRRSLPHQIRRRLCCRGQRFCADHGGRPPASSFGRRWLARPGDRGGG
jgi:predicted dehydrogenase